MDLLKETGLKKVFMSIAGDLIEGLPEMILRNGNIEELPKRLIESGKGMLFDNLHGYLRSIGLDSAVLDNVMLGDSDKVTVKYTADNPATNLNGNPRKVHLTYELNGRRHSEQFTVYGGLRDYLQGVMVKSIEGKGETADREVSTRFYTESYLQEPVEAPYLDGLVGHIRSLTSDHDERARVAISLVQNIPYDYDLYKRIMNHQPLDDTRRGYPYEVLYDNAGICGQKSMLLIYLLRSLGFGTAAIMLDDESHMAAGIKAPRKQSYRNSGYAYIESTTPTPINVNSFDGNNGHDKKRVIAKISPGLTYNAESTGLLLEQQMRKLLR